MIYLLEVNAVKITSESRSPNLDFLLKTSDTLKPVPALGDKYLTWPGKEKGKPKPPIIWLKE